MELIHDTAIITAIFAAGMLAGYLLKVVMIYLSQGSEVSA